MKMKSTFRYFILLAIFCTVSFTGFSQKSSKTKVKEVPVAGIDQSQVINLIKERSVFYNVKQFGAKGDSITKQLKPLQLQVGGQYISRQGNISAFQYA
jgi:hypothetical protein